MKKFSCFALLSEGIVTREQIQEHDSSEVHCSLGLNLAAAEVECNGKREESTEYFSFHSRSSQGIRTPLLTVVQKLAGT